MPGLSLFSQELLGYEYVMVSCAVGLVGLFYGSSPASPPIFSFIIIKIPLMAKYSMIFLYSNLLITLGFWVILIIAIWREGD